MKTLYIDAGMGAAGDMLTGALLELVTDKEEFIKKVNNIGIPGVSVSISQSVKCGITGTHVNVLCDGVSEEDMHHEHHHDHEHHHYHEHHHEHDHHHEHGHHHSSMADIEAIVDSLNVSDHVKGEVKKVYKLIAQAESVAHNKPVTDIHFHEVGTMDAIADVTAVCMLIEEISPDKIYCSPIHVGSGHVHCAHGILPVPAPATAYILKDCPIYSGHIQGELCTPTGAALLKNFSDEFKAMPPMKLKSIGYGMGYKDFEQANCVRVLLGESEDIKDNDTIVVLECNIDDMTPEDISYAKEMLFEAGAREVFSNAVYMKKNRDGVMLTAICDQENKDKIVECIFANTSTIGIRERIDRRYVLKREVTTVKTKFGDVRVKKSSGYGVERIKYEHDDLENIARENGISIAQVRDELDNIHE